MKIFERFWERIAAHGRPGDNGIVLALAGHARDGKPYPLLRSQWREVESATTSNSPGSAAGWLRCAEGGELSFAHDRLLNWAVAKRFANRHARAELSIDELGAQLLGASDGPNARRSLRRLGYVPMDTLWLLSEDERNRTDISSLVARLEESQEYGSYGEALYEHLLPTLGQRAVPILLERLEVVASADSRDYRVGLIGKAFGNLARQEAVDLEETVAELLNSPSRDRQTVAIAAITSAPSSRYLDRLWELHQLRYYAWDKRTDGSAHVDYGRALPRCGLALQRTRNGYDGGLLNPNRRANPFQSWSICLMPWTTRLLRRSGMTPVIS